MELATLEWVSWFNHLWLMEPIGYLPQAEAEANDCRQQTEQAVPARLKPTRHHKTRVDSKLHPKQHGDFTQYISALDLVADMGHDGVRCISSSTTNRKEFLHHE